MVPSGSRTDLPANPRNTLSMGSAVSFQGGAGLGSSQPDHRRSKAIEAVRGTTEPDRGQDPQSSSTVAAGGDLGALVMDAISEIRAIGNKVDTSASRFEDLDARMVVVEKTLQSLPGRLGPTVTDTASPISLRQMEEKLNTMKTRLQKNEDDKISLTSQVSSIQDERSRLKSELDDAQRKLAASNKHLKQKSQTLEDLQRQCQTLKQHEAKLRKIIVEGAEDQKVDDVELGSKYSSLRQKVQKIAMSPVFQPLKQSYITGRGSNIDDPFLRKSHAQFCMDWRQLRDTLNPDGLVLRLRAEIFALLNSLILSNSTFGVQAIDEDGVLEFALKKFEWTQKERRVKPETTAQWRIATLKVIEEMDIVEQASTREAGRIFAYLQPLFSDRYSRQQADHLRDDLVRLCKEAYIFSTEIRKSKSYYRCVTPDPDTPMEQWSDQVEEPMAVEDLAGVGGVPSQDIAFCLFGALVKYPEGNFNDGRVLEKAHVVVKVTPTASGG